MRTNLVNNSETFGKEKKLTAENCKILSWHVLLPNPVQEKGIT